MCVLGGGGYVITQELLIRILSTPFQRHVLVAGVLKTLRNYHTIDLDWEDRVHDTEVQGKGKRVGTFMIFLRKYMWIARCVMHTTEIWRADSQTEPKKINKSLLRTFR